MGGIVAVLILILWVMVRKLLSLTYASPIKEAKTKPECLRKQRIPSLAEDDSDDEALIVALAAMGFTDGEAKDWTRHCQEGNVRDQLTEVLRQHGEQ